MTSADVVRRIIGDWPAALDETLVPTLRILSADQAEGLATQLLEALPAGAVDGAELQRLRRLVEVVAALPGGARPDHNAVALALARYRRALRRQPDDQRASIGAVLDVVFGWLGGVSMPGTALRSVHRGLPTRSGWIGRVRQTITASSGVLRTDGDGGHTGLRATLTQGGRQLRGTLPTRVVTAAQLDRLLRVVSTTVVTPGAARAKPPANPKPPPADDRPSPARTSTGDREPRPSTGQHSDPARTHTGDSDAPPPTLAPPTLAPPAPAPPAPAPPAPAPPAPTTTPAASARPASTRYFTGELQPPPTSPVEAGKPYTLAVSVVVARSGAALGRAAVAEALIFTADDTADANLTVQLESPDCDIVGSTSQPLTVPRIGPSPAPALFAIVPRRTGPCRITATVHASGNFVQQVEFTLLVGSTNQPVVTGSSGRPVDAAAGLRPRDLTFILGPADGGGFQCTVIAPAGATSIQLPITGVELAAAVDTVRQALLAVVQTRDQAGRFAFQSQIDIPPEDSATSLAPVAKAGARLFQRLFEHPGGSVEATQVGQLLKTRAMDPGAQLTIQIVSTQASLPWSLLYLGDAADPSGLDWQNFLGMRHVVEQLPLQKPAAMPDVMIASDQPQLQVSVNVNATIDAQWGTDLVFEQQKFWAKAQADRPRLTVVDRSTSAELVQALNNGLTADQIVYLYCHATAVGVNGVGNSDDSSIDLDGQPITLGDLNLSAPMSVTLPGHPLVFINACESAELSPLFYDGFAPYFISKGARGVIGTECKTPGTFAADWATRFFERFLDGAALGETMLGLSRSYLLDHHNPLGLLYAMHCSADTRITPALVHPAPTPGT